MHESRITDLHKVAQKYVDLREADVEALRDQLMSLPNEVAASIKNMFDSYSTENTKEGIIARDADLLEYGFQAKEFMVKGYKDAEIWLDNINKLVKTPTAKKLATQLYDSNPNEWWKGLKKIER
jgi:5'-deoxynucleotidase YfbR-like HD superfamily hydrolase